MHPEALLFIGRAARHLPPGASVVELGSWEPEYRVRGQFASHPYTGIDLRPGGGVDIVADAADWDGGGRQYECVVCAEVLEHSPRWRRIIQNAYKLLTPGGLLILTAASLARPPHSALIPGPPQPGEYYRNIDPKHLFGVLDALGYIRIDVTTTPNGEDVQATAYKP